MDVERDSPIPCTATSVFHLKCRLQTVWNITQDTFKVLEDGNAANIKMLTSYFEKLGFKKCHH